MRQTTVLMPHLCTLVWWPRTWPQAFVGRIQHSKDEHIQPDFSFRKDVAVLVSSVSPLRWPSACMSGSLFAPWRVRLSCLTAPALASHSCFQCVARVKQFRQIKKRFIHQFGCWSELRSDELQLGFFLSAHLEPDEYQIRSISDCGYNSCRSAVLVGKAWIEQHSIDADEANFLSSSFKCLTSHEMSNSSFRTRHIPTLTVVS